MKKYRLTEDMAQDRKHWMTKTLASPTQGDGQERREYRKNNVDHNLVILILQHKDYVHHWYSCLQCSDSFTYVHHGYTFIKWTGSFTLSWNFILSNN